MNRPPVNSLSRQLIEELAAAVTACRTATATDGTSALLITGTGRFFSAGAEIREFKIAREHDAVQHAVPAVSLIDLIHLLEDYPKPTIALVNGFALGGGCELAMGAHYRVAVGRQAVKWGLPEVHLGLLPAATGTQRLPRLVGAATALRIMLNGAPLPAQQGRDLGVFDALVDTPSEALAACRELALRPALPLRTRAVADPLTDDDVRETLARLGKARAREAACQAIVACVRAAHLPYGEGTRVEKEQFGALMRNSESPALQYLFFAERAAAKVADASADARAQPVKSVGVVGAGLMGTGIAASFAAAGHHVIVVDDSPAALDGSKRALASMLHERQQSLVQHDGQLQALASVDLVIEAVFEDLELKKGIFARLDGLCKPSAFLCSNTSALDIDAMAAATKRPDKVMGLHFFSPANKMQLLEEVRGRHTSHATLLTMMQLAKSIKKIPVLVGNCHGFVGNRLFAKYCQSAERLVLAGLTPAQVDTAAEQWGMKMGPFAVHDLVGLELRYRQRAKAQIADARRDIFDALVESGRHGLKNRRGFYTYDDGRRVRTEDPEVVQIIRSVAAELGIAEAAGAAGKTSDEIALLLHLELINEAFLALDEGMAQRPSDIDVVFVFGYGSPRWRGGPLFFAEHQLGFPVCLAELQSQGIKPAPMLVDLVASRLSLDDYWTQRERSRTARL